jgi:hypothetical protein
MANVFTLGASIAARNVFFIRPTLSSRASGFHSSGSTQETPHSIDSPRPNSQTTSRLIRILIWAAMIERMVAIRDAGDAACSLHYSAL